MVFLAWFTPILGEMALKFGAYEFFWLAAFGVLMMVAIIGVPLAAAFLAADCIPLRRGHAIASAVALVGLPLALLVPVWGWVAAAAVVAAQVAAWAGSRR